MHNYFFTSTVLDLCKNTLPSSKANPTLSFLNSSCRMNFSMPSLLPISSSIDVKDQFIWKIKSMLICINYIKRIKKSIQPFGNFHQTSNNKDENRKNYDYIL